MHEIKNIGQDEWEVFKTSFEESILNACASRDFIGKDNNVFPGRIIVSDINTDSVIEVRIIRLAKPWDGEIKFIPGNRYEKVMIK